MKLDVCNYTIAPELRAANPVLDEILYPSDDGLPMSDNTLQFEYITSLKQGFDDLYRDDPEVFVAGNLLWYPAEGNNKISAAPDVMIAFERPKGYRSSYLQWLENNIPPAFVLEILSPGNRPGEMAKKAAFYQRYGVQEYVIYDPDQGSLSVLTRDDTENWQEESEPNGWKSNLTGVTFFLLEKALLAVRSDGKKFETYAEARQRAQNEFQRAETATQRAEAEAQRAEAEAQRAETEARRAAEAIKKQQLAKEENARLIEILRQAGINPS